MRRSLLLSALFAITSLVFVSISHSLDIYPSGLIQTPQGGTGQQSFTAGNILFGNGTSGINTTSTFTVSNAGNIGIGTANPAQKIHLSSGTLYIDGNVANALIIPGATQLAGIGTATPVTTLQVNGMITSTGTTSASANPATNGVFRLSNAESVSWRNAANNGNDTLANNNADHILWNGVVFVTATNGIQFKTKTRAQFDTLVPYFVGETYSCSDCTRAYDICVATGTSAAQWRTTGNTNGCGTNN